MQMSNGKMYRLAVSFPFFVDTASCQALFENSLRELHITLEPLLLTTPSADTPAPNDAPVQKTNINIQLQTQDLYEIF